jgi:hypothetical protein
MTDISRDFPTNNPISYHFDFLDDLHHGVLVFPIVIIDAVVLVVGDVVFVDNGNNTSTSGVYRVSGLLMFLMLLDDPYQYIVPPIPTYQYVGMK